MFKKEKKKQGRKGLDCKFVLIRIYRERWEIGVSRIMINLFDISFLVLVFLNLGHGWDR